MSTHANPHAKQCQLFLDLKEFRPEKDGEVISEIPGSSVNMAETRQTDLLLNPPVCVGGTIQYSGKKWSLELTTTTAGPYIAYIKPEGGGGAG